MKFSRVFTRGGGSPYEMFSHTLRKSILRNPDGSVVFEMENVEVPTHWSQLATDILAQKYFRKTGVPQYNSDGSRFWTSTAIKCLAAKIQSSRWCIAWRQPGSIGASNIIISIRPKMQTFSTMN